MRSGNKRVWRLVVAATAAPVLLLSACGGGSTATDSDTTSPTATDTSVPEEGPSPVLQQEPSEPEVSWDVEIGPVDIVNPEGYTGSLEYRLQAADYAVEIANSKPGKAEVVRIPGVLEASFSNTTEGRNSPAPLMVRAWAYYPADSAACGDVLAHEQNTADPSVPIKEPAVPMWATNDQYCFIVSELTGSYDYGLGGLPAGKRTSVASEEGFGVGITDPKYIDIVKDVDEEFAAALGESLSSPVGFLIEVAGWTTVDGSGCSAPVTDSRGGLSKTGVLPHEGGAGLSTGPLCK